MNDLFDKAISRLKDAEDRSLTFYDVPPTLCYSGGKDSDIVLDLALKSGIDMIVSHNLTTADAPDTVNHVKDVFRKLDEKGIKTQIIKPTYKGHRISMWSLIPIKKNTTNKAYALLLFCTQRILFRT